MIRVAINGYGRIGRALHRRTLQTDDVQVVAINSRSGADSHAYLLKRDSIYGTLDAEVSYEGDELIVNGDRIAVFQELDPSKLDWSSLGVDVVIESTGKFTRRAEAELHLQAGAQKILITAPCKDESVQTIVMGVNHAQHDPKQLKVVSNASCTSNAVAPMVMVLDRAFGIESAMMSTLHAFTDSQNLLDNSSPKDFRRARATTESIIPTSTGATIAVTQVLPQLAGRITGMSFRVPTASVSLIDLVVCFKQKVTVDEINEAFLKAESEDLRGILGTSDEPLVSVDYRGDTRSGVVDLLSTKVVNDRMAQVVVWYDNEWGYASRVLDEIRWIVS